MPQVDFEFTRRRLESFVKTTGINAPFLTESLLRLSQLHWLCKRIEGVEDLALSGIQEATTSDNMDAIHPSVLELQTLTEAFYYIAWRLIALLDRTDSPVNDLRGLRSKCRGIRIVRNKLLEHPESRDSRVHLPSIMFGTSRGPQLKFIAEIQTGDDGNLKCRTNSTELFDNGLWANASELKAAIDEKLGSSIYT
jgi:hypothetical protein